MLDGLRVQGKGRPKKVEGALRVQGMEGAGRMQEEEERRTDGRCRKEGAGSRRKEDVGRRV